MDETNSLGPSSTRVEETSSKQHQFAPKRSGLETLISAQAEETAALEERASAALARGVPTEGDDALDDDASAECRGRFLTTHDYDFPETAHPQQAWRAGPHHWGYCLAFDEESVAKYFAAPSLVPPDAATKRCFPATRNVAVNVVL